MSLIDISPVLSPRVAVWPGDVSFQRHIALSMKQGHNLELSSITTTVHVGAHVDAPNHYIADGDGIATRNLERYLGLCQVIDVDIDRGQRIRPADVHVKVQAPRVLFRTGTFPDPDTFNEDFASLSPELVDWLHDQGVQLVGLDTPSIDLCHDADLVSHNAVARHDMAILEGVVLSHVTPGIYTLIALPLRLEGADASPVRAVLLPADALTSQ